MIQPIRRCGVSRTIGVVGEVVVRKARLLATSEVESSAGTRREPTRVGLASDRHEEDADPVTRGQLAALLHRAIGDS